MLFNKTLFVLRKWFGDVRLPVRLPVRFAIALLIVLQVSLPSSASYMCSQVWEKETYSIEELAQPTWFQYWYAKAKEIPDIDHTKLWAFLLRNLIFTTNTEVEKVFIPIEHLHFMHPITFAASQAKLEARVLMLNSKKEELLELGMISQEIQNDTIPSVTPMRVVKDNKGRYVLFDGNGRLEALKRSFADNPEMLIEVENYVVENDLTMSVLDRVRRMRGLLPDDGP